MDKAKIMRLIYEADDIVSALYKQGANKDYKCKSLREKLKAIAAEITAQPKSNGDRIRQMTDEELSDVMQGQCACCAYQLTGCTERECKDGAYEWLQKEADEDAGTDD